MRIKPRMIAIPRGPKKLVNPLEELPLPLDGLEFDWLDGDDTVGDALPGN